MSVQTAQTNFGSPYSPVSVPEKVDVEAQAMHLGDDDVITRSALLHDTSGSESKRLSLELSDG
jgi:hypothetical protein